MKFIKVISQAAEYFGLSAMWYRTTGNVFKVLAIFLCTCISASADDIDIYSIDNSNIGANPNLLFVLDTSASMNNTLTASVYDPTVDYSMDVPAGESSCQNGRIYIGLIDASVPECNTVYWTEADKWQCKNAYDNLGLHGEMQTTGMYADKFARWNNQDDKWLPLNEYTDDDRPDTDYYECEDDHNQHGQNISSSDTDSNDQNKIRQSPGGPWTTDSNYYYLWEDRDMSTRIAFTGNYLNWYHYGSDVNRSPISRIQVVVDAISDIINSVSDLNIGLMRFNKHEVTRFLSEDRVFRLNNHGGSIISEIQDIDQDTNRQDMIDELRKIVATNNPDGPDGNMEDNPYLVESATPLVETVYEGMQYFRGQAVGFGKPYPDPYQYDDGIPIIIRSVGSSRKSPTQGEDGYNEYLSPIVNSCAANYMVIFSDGEPEIDDEADNAINSLISGLPDSNTDPDDSLDECDSNENTFKSVDSCLNELANYMFISDHADNAYGNHQPGEQNITSYYISGFDEADDELMTQAAIAGGTERHYSASDPAGFVLAFNAVISDILKVNTSFTSPGVSVNALNRLKNNNDLYFALFEPDRRAHWDGNIKKYELKTTGQLVDGEPEVIIADANGDNAVDPTTGLFKGDDETTPSVDEGAQSYWFLDADERDGDQTSEGGAANRLYDYGSSGHSAGSRRGRVFTYLTDYPPDEPEFDGEGIDLISVEFANTDPDLTVEDSSKITKSSLGMANSVPDDEFYRRVVWMHGVDVLDEDQDGDFFDIANVGDTNLLDQADTRNIMGGILHTEPVLVNYAVDRNTQTQNNVIMVTTNDGYFHLIKTDPSTENPDERLEYSAIIPKRTLRLMEPLYNDVADENAEYRLDGNIDVWRHDAGDDGTISRPEGDHVYAYFGQRRGGNSIFAFDVTDYTTPKLLWEINPETLEDADLTDATIGPFQYMGQTWSKPTHAAILVNDGVGNLERQDVIVFGGGYDSGSDDVEGHPENGIARNYDNLGATIYMVDAKTGGLIWWAGGPNLANVSPPSDAQFADMRYSFPSDIRVIDLNGDTIADKMFATDTGGQLWRFDISNSSGQSIYDRITGGVVADLQKPNAGASDTGLTNRRVYNSPDVSILQRNEEDTPVLGVAIGTGYRAHPLNTVVVDRFYVLKYADVFSTPVSYENIKLYEDDLLDVTNRNFADPDERNNLQPGDRDFLNLNNNGWYINLEDTGEKALSESVTVDGKVVFSTYTPPSSNEPDDGQCLANQGSAKAYVIDVFDARPVADLTPGGDTDLELNDRSYDVTTQGIPPEPKIVFPDLPDVQGQEVGGRIISGREVIPVNLEEITATHEIGFWINE